jgi:hypothetical protein
VVAAGAEAVVLIAGVAVLSPQATISIARNILATRPIKGRKILKWVSI